MNRYIVERTFPTELSIPITPAGAEMVRGVVATNALGDVTWIHSYVSADKTKTFCVYDGPSPEAIKSVAAANRLPIDSITAVSVLDPYFYS